MWQCQDKIRPVSQKKYLISSWTSHILALLPNKTGLALERQFSLMYKHSSNSGPILAKRPTQTGLLLRHWTRLQHVCFQRRSVYANIYISAGALANLRLHLPIATKLLRATIFRNKIYKKKRWSLGFPMLTQMVGVIPLPTDCTLKIQRRTLCLWK
jgi:hypothetical protein